MTVLPEILPAAPKARGSVRARMRMARLVAAQLLYTGYIEPVSMAQFSAWAQRWPALHTQEEILLLTAEPQLVQAILKLHGERQEDVVGLLSPALPAEWALSRLVLPLRAILEAAVSEMLAMEDFAPQAISDYVDVTKALVDDASAKMANAVLDRVFKLLRR